MSHEIALLGALLANNAVYMRVQPFLEPAHFTNPEYGRLFCLIKGHIEAGEPVDALRMRAQHRVNEDLLMHILANMVGVSNAGEYALSIHNTWVRRWWQHIDAPPDHITKLMRTTGCSFPEAVTKLS